MGGLRIRLFGEVELSFAGDRPAELGSMRAESLLAYLIVHRQESVPRQRLAYTELSAVTRRPVTFVDLPEEAARTAFTQAGLPEWLVTHLTCAFAVIRRDGLSHTGTAVRDLTGRPARTFAHFARDHAAAFRA